ncbi:hypothetical protein PIB30_083106 [Stylosanthes scabra]|uniref:Uncharacterized protein n=1 Tax=Stylosanthes scabra TaxID=79078 RepID=A0ABU6SSX5_9FABA|nr:hypothetical protein [Stylosanthes scabra]
MATTELTFPYAVHRRRVVRVTPSPTANSIHQENELSLCRSRAVLRPSPPLKGPIHDSILYRCQKIISEIEPAMVVTRSNLPRSNSIRLLSPGVTGPRSMTLTIGPQNFMWSDFAKFVYSHLTSCDEPELKKKEKHRPLLTIVDRRDWWLTSIDRR